MKYITIICLTLLTIMPHAFAGEGASAVLNIRVGITQCGKMENIAKACERNSVCCVFIKDKAIEDFEIADASLDSHSCTLDNTQTNGVYNPLCITNSE